MRPVRRKKKKRPFGDEERIKSARERLHAYLSDFSWGSGKESELDKADDLEKIIVEFENSDKHIVDRVKFRVKMQEFENKHGELHWGVGSDNPDRIPER